MEIKNVTPEQVTHELRLTRSELKLIHLALGKTSSRDAVEAGLERGHGLKMYMAIGEAFLKQ